MFETVSKINLTPAEPGKKMPEILALVFEHAGVGLAFYDRDLRFVHINDQLAEINGFPAQEHIGKTLSDLLPDVGNLVESLLRPVVDQGRVVENVKITGMTAAQPGVQRNWLASYYPNRNAEGDIVGLLAVVREVTNELKIEGALAESDSRLQMAMTGSGLGVWDWSVDTNSVWFSDTWQTMLGYEPGEVPQHVSSWQTAVHPDDWPIINAALEPHLAGLTENYECEHRVRCKDGSWLWILDRGRVVKRDAEGRAVRVIGTHDNIQHRKEAEMFRSALLDLSSDLTELETVSHIVDRALITLVETLDVDFAAYTESETKDGTPRMARRWRGGRSGMSAGRWFGVRMYKDIARQLIRGESVAVRDLAAMDSPEFEDVGGATDGEDLRAVLVVPILRHDWLVGTLLAGHRQPMDWTPQQSAFLSDVRDRMREAIARAKAGEANRQAQEELQRVGRLNALSALASTLAHELNQPLAAASNYLTVARMQIKRAGFEGVEPDLPSPVETVDLAAGQVVKAGEIIRQMRAYTNSGEVMARPCVVTKSVDAALETTLASMAPLALSIRKTYTPDLPEVKLDDVQFQQVISNLVRNAIEAMDGQERPELTLNVTRSRDQMAVEVCDNGPGLSDAVLETLFQPFRSSKRRGLGLGLPICRTIIEAHGGKLTGEPHPEGGARFRIVLPLS